MMFEKPITNFDDFDWVMKMNLIRSARNLCEELYKNDIISCADYDDCKDELTHLIEVIDGELH